MNIALCLYGQINGGYKNYTGRFVKNDWIFSSNYIQKNIIQPLRDLNHNVTLFTSAMATNQNEIEVMKTFYKPKKSVDRLSEKPALLKDMRVVEDFCLKICLRHIHDCIYLALNDTDIKYDVIMCMRFDFVPLQSITPEIQSYADGNFYMVYGPTLRERKLGNNTFVYGNSDVIKLYADMYKNMDLLLEKTNTNSIHQYIKHVFEEANFVFEKNILPINIDGYINKFPYNKNKKN